MTQDEKQIAIAEACGATNIKHQPFGVIRCDFPGWSYRIMPDYFGSLDAMHEAEKVFADNSQQAHRFLDALITEVRKEEPDPSTNAAAVFFIVHATAAQRAEAFGRTLNLWTE